MSGVVARLPDDLREDLKPPLGPVFTEPEPLLAAAGEPVIAVGDVVTAHLLRAGHPPDLAVIDDRTERRPVDDAVQAALPAADQTVENPPATVTGELVEAIQVGLDREGPTTLRVDGEEDLATLPAVMLAGPGASIVYGQPGEGMVLVTVDPAMKRQARSLLDRFDGDVAELLALLEESQP